MYEEEDDAPESIVMVAPSSDEEEGSFDDSCCYVETPMTIEQYLRMTSSSADKEPPLAPLGHVPTELDPRTIDPVASAVLESDGIDALVSSSGNATTDRDVDSVFLLYLQTGYCEYAKWYVDQLAKTVPEEEKDALCERALFCVMRHLNMAYASYLKANPVDKIAPGGAPYVNFACEIRYVLACMLLGGEEEEFTNSVANKALAAAIERVKSIWPPSVPTATEMAISIIKELVQYVQVAQVDIKEFLTRITLQQFVDFISRFDDEAFLAEHSSRLWRGTYALLGVNQISTKDVHSGTIQKILEDLHVDTDLIWLGEPYAPLPGFHIGVDYFIRHGHLSAEEEEESDDLMMHTSSAISVMSRRVTLRGRGGGGHH